MWYQYKTIVCWNVKKTKFRILLMNVPQDYIYRDTGSLYNLISLDLSGNNFLYLPFGFLKLPLLISLCFNDFDNHQTLSSILNLEYLEILELGDCQKMVITVLTTFLQFRRSTWLIVLLCRFHLMKASLVPLLYRFHLGNIWVWS